VSTPEQPVTEIVENESPDNGLEGVYELREEKK
jgi:hypothetical protein